MARIDYDERAAAAFQAGRQLPLAGLGQWRAAITRHLAPMAGMRILDLGAGTGMWAVALASWYDAGVVAVEPSAAMRARSSCVAMIGGDAMALPLGAASMDGAWLSTVLHHLSDLPAAARELARAGLARLRADAAIDTGPVIDTLDLLVLHHAGARAQDGT